MEDRWFNYLDEIGRVEVKKKREIWKMSKVVRGVDLRIGVMVVVCRLLLKVKRWVFKFFFDLGEEEENIYKK